MATAAYHFYNYEGEIVLRNVEDTNNNGDDEDEENSEDEWLSLLFSSLFSSSYPLYDYARKKAFTRTVLFIMFVHVLLFVSVCFSFSFTAYNVFFFFCLSSSHPNVIHIDQ